MSRAEIDAGICGFQTTCTATRMSAGTVQLQIESGCSAVMKLAEQLQIVEPFKEVFWRRSMPGIYDLAPKCLSHPACPVPSGIIKAIEVEAGLALPKDVTIKVTKTGD